MEVQALFAFTLLALYISGVRSATFTITNKCPFTVWPGALTPQNKPQLSTTGFELAPKASFSIEAPNEWSGRFWGRTNCTTNPSSGNNFTCQTGDCGSGQITCNNKGGIPPASLAEFTLAPNGGQDFYDVSLVDGFNLPLSISPQGGQGGNCTATGCPANVNSICPKELAVKGLDGRSVISCKSACLEFKQPQYCCNGEYGSPDKCQPTNYSRIFKGQCPQAYSYAFDDKSSLFTCFGGPSYAITFCP